jgi:hypothetical protein
MCYRRGWNKQPQTPNDSIWEFLNNKHLETIFKWVLITKKELPKSKKHIQLYQFIKIYHQDMKQNICL